MQTVTYDNQTGDDERRKRLYQGQLVVLPASPSSKALCEFAQKLSEEAFHPHHPTEAQHHFSVDDYIAILKELKPKFIHHPTCKELITAMLGEYGCDLDQTYFDVPRLRTSTSDNYLTSGLAYAFHPHRDTWYSAPFQQLNWWLPVYGIEEDNCLGFHPPYWTQAVKNGSSGYDYYRWNKESRAAAATQGKKDTRKQPHAEEEIDLDSTLRLLCGVGEVIVFSAAQMHSSVPNTSGKTRVSIDFRTVNRGDVEQEVGAPNVDSACTGTTLRDYMRASDLQKLPEETIRILDPNPPEDAMLVYENKK